MKFQNKTLLYVILILTFIAILALWPVPNASQDKQTDTSPVPIGGPFTLTDQHGNTVKDADFRGRVMLVFFGFTHCPDICPTTVSTLSKAMEALGDKANHVAPIFITVDPKRDTKEKMADYLSSFDKRIVGLTGGEEAIKKTADAYRVYFSILSPASSDMDYMVDHSAILYMIDERGNYLRHFPYDASVAEITAAINEHLE